ncbi:hypothetical protein CYMTET_7505 [Cymbomonas tetramitiformis]|uniref:Reverse transcriptase domain-containing protein n=1 Tax=Cymbomonas tetramitiformis TaxID=36881 RepID=A0AAE0LH06_9CHLO|nr:hypothetical protein CYMTET_7505 [Cymbomonas tetramitiformis]
MAAADEATNVRSEEEVKSVYGDLRLVARMLAMSNGVDKKCDAVAPTLDRCVRFFEAADVQNVVEMLSFGLALGGFTPAVRDGRGKVTEKAILKPPARERPAFVAALVEAAEQCVEVLVAQLGFKLPEVLQQSVSEYRTSDKRAREDNDDNEEEEQADDKVFEEGEEVATVPPVNKKGKGSAGISPDDLARDEELKRRMDALLMRKVSGYAPATGKDLYDFDTQVRDDIIAGRLKSWDPIQLGFRFQYSFLETLGEASRRLLDDKGSRGARGVRDHREKGAKAKTDRKDGVCDFFQLARGCKKVEQEELEEVQEPVPPVSREPAGGKGKTARTGKARKPERMWSARFMAMFTAVGVSLASYGVPEAEHRQYMQDVEAVGAMVSPLTERADRWAQAAWGLPGADAVVRGVAKGFSWQQAEPDEFFRVEKYVPPEHKEKVALKLQEEEDAGRMVRTNVESVPGVSALGIVLRVVDGKVTEGIVQDLSRPVGLSVNDNCVIDKRRFQSVETTFGLLQPYSYMAKIDLKSAYRFVGIAAPLFRFLGSEFRDVLRIDTRFPFGAKAAPGLFSDITQLVRLMMQQRGFPGIVVYLDDFILVADTEEDCQRGFEILLELVEYLGFEVAPEKVESPRQDLVFLGVRLQSNQLGLGIVAMSIEESRVQRVASACREMAVLPTVRVRVKEVERLVGQLMFCARVVYGAKMLLRSGYDFIGRAGRMRRFYDKMPGDLSRDLLWLAKMLEVYNGQAVVLIRRPVVRDFFVVDAAGEEAVDGGMGGFFGGRWFAVKWEEVRQWKVQPFSPFRDVASSHINYLELFVIFWALKKWGHLLRGCKVVMWSDNEATRLMTGNLWGKATFIPSLKEIMSLTIGHDVRVVMKRISTKANDLADALSRSQMRRFYDLLELWSRREAPRDLDDWMIKDWLWDKVRALGPFAVDACCDEVGGNSRCFRWWSKEDSCLLKHWRGLNVYCNPPFSLLWEILTHFLKEKRAAPHTTSAVFVLPFWPTERFWLELVVPAIDAGLLVVLEYIPEDSDVFTSPNRVGITTSVILFCSHFHQVAGDIAAGKRSPVVRLGVVNASKVLCIPVIAIYGLVMAFVVAGWLPIACVMLYGLTIPAALQLLSFVRENHLVPEKVAPAKIFATKWHTLTGLMLAIGLTLPRLRVMFGMP